MLPRAMTRWLRAIQARLTDGAGHEGGAVAVIFALSLLVLAPLALGVVDIYMSSSQRSRLQDALDAAALYAARSTATDPEELSDLGARALRANLSPADAARLVNSSFALSDSTIVASAEMGTRSLAVALWDHGVMKVSTEVVRASANLEVSLVLDITGSMGGSRISSLKTAAKDLIDLVVQDVQTPYYSKVAIVPYANAVNVGDHLVAVRGATTAKPISAATKKRPVKITSSKHGFSNGDIVVIDHASGMDELNGETYKVANSHTDTFELKTTPDGSPVNGRRWGSYRGDGEVFCTGYGCEYYYFRDNSYHWNTFEAADCVSERTGSDRYTDASPDTSPVGFVYSSNGGGCPSAEIVPLSSDKTALKKVITDLKTGGTTAGQIGIAWGWYMVSPNFGYLWDDASSAPADYSEDELLKAVVLMTDGEFNTAYCNGVMSRDSSGGGDRADCNATNGNPYSQSKALCDAMKQKDIVIYTVGFGISSGSSAANLLSYCATDAKHEYLPASGQDLQDAFQAIGQDINSLRLSY